MIQKRPLVLSVVAVLVSAVTVTFTNCAGVRSLGSSTAAAQMDYDSKVTAGGGVTAAPVASQGVSVTKATAPSMGGCGLIKSGSGSRMPLRNSLLIAVLMLLPLLIITSLRGPPRRVRVRSNRRRF